MKTSQTGIAALALALLFSLAASAQQVLTNPDVSDPLQADVSSPVGAMVLKAAARTPGESKESTVLLRPKLQQILDAARHPSTLAAPAAPLRSPLARPVPIKLGVNRNGVGNGFGAYFVPDAPTDVNLAVGDTQVVQWVNVSYAVFDKVTGNVLAGPIDGGLLWAGFGGRCESHNDGDIIVQWDKLAHRWVMMQSVFGLPFLTCLAVSTSPDATGTFYRYAFPQLGGLPDYPKWAIQADAYYQSQNAFSGGPGGGRYMGAHACAYDRRRMLAGDPRAKQICFTTGTFDDSLLPADLDSTGNPSARGDDDDSAQESGGSAQPEVFIGSIDNFDPANSNTLYKYLFHADFEHPRQSTFAGAGGTMPITVAPFALGCGGFAACVDQPDVFSKLDSLGDRLMYRLAYRKFGDHQTWLVSHSVGLASGQLAERWYEFRAPPNSTNLSVYQQGTYAPDASSRWMGSLAMDKVGNIAIGYSVSSATVFPSIFVTGRTPGDALGTLRGEIAIVNGTGSQDDTFNRWGDYTSMAIDGADGCTFWYTNQYYLTTSSFNWSTQIASLKFSNCK